MGENRDLPAPSDKNLTSDRGRRLVRRGLADLETRANYLWPLEKIERLVGEHGAPFALEELRESVRQNPTAERIERQAQVLEAEAASLDGWQIAAEPGYFLQQWRNRCFALGFENLQSEAETLLRQRRLSYLNVVWQRQSDEKYPPKFSEAAVSPDGKSAVLTSDYSAISVGLDTGKTTDLLTHVGGDSLHAAFSSDGRFLAAVGLSNDGHSGGGQLEIIDTETGAVVMSDENLPYSNDLGIATGEAPGTFVLSSGGVFRVIDVHTQTILRSYWVQYKVDHLAISRSGRFGVITAGDMLAAWDLVSDELLWSGSVRPSRRDWGSVCGVVITADEQRVVFGCKGQLQVWNAATGQKMQTIQCVDATIEAIAMGERNNHIAFAAAGPSIWVCDLDTGAIVKRLESNIKKVLDLAASGDSHLVATTDTDGTIRIWDWQRGSAVQAIAEPANLVAFSHDARHVITVSDTVKMWDIRSGALYRVLDGSCESARGLAVSANGQNIAVSDGSHVQIWVIATGQRWNARDLGGSGGGLAFEGDGRKLWVGWYRWILQVDVMSRELRLLNGEDFSVEHMVVSPDGQYIATFGTLDVFDERRGWSWGVSKGVLKIFDAHTGRFVRSILGLDPSCFAISPNSKYMAAVYPPGASGVLPGMVNVTAEASIHIMELGTGATRQVLPGHTTRLWSLAFSPDGRWLASVGEDGQLRVWDVLFERLALRLPLAGPNGCCAFTPDGKIVVGDFAGYIQLLIPTHYA